jgi:hypothetical protein
VDVLDEKEATTGKKYEHRQVPAYFLAKRR